MKNYTFIFKSGVEKTFEYVDNYNDNIMSNYITFDWCDDDDVWHHTKIDKNEIVMIDESDYKARA